VGPKALNITRSLEYGICGSAPTRTDLDRAIYFVKINATQRAKGLAALSRPGPWFIVQG
jgi:hypothetical protein